MSITYFRKYERTTQEQLQYFVAFSKQYPDILKSSYGKGHMQNLWISLAENLNNMRGPTRSADKWKECLKNRINQIRCRARKSMLGWNNRKACTSKNKEMDEHDNLENTIEDLSDANTSNMMQVVAVISVYI